MGKVTSCTKPVSQDDILHVECEVSDKAGLKCALQEGCKYTTNRCNGTFMIMTIMVADTDCLPVPDLILCIL